MTKKIPLLLFFALTIFSFTYAKNEKALNLNELSINEIEEIFDQANQEFKIKELEALADTMSQLFNGSMLIVRHDEVLLKHNFGQLCLYKDGNLRTCEENAVTSSTVFELASMSKQFTAVSILQLVEKGSLSLQDSLQKFFPELPYRGITLHHLLTHTSGLPEYLESYEKYFSGNVLVSNQEVINLLARRRDKVLFSPGRRFKYTNTNYLLLARIVELVTGETFPDYVREHLLKPAGMTESFYVCETQYFKDKLVAMGHDRKCNTLSLKGLDGTVGDKGLYSSAEELFLWKKALFDDHKILSDSLLQKAITKQNHLLRNAVSNEDYGYGFRLENRPPHGYLVFHGGLWHGFQNLFLYRPADDLTVIFLTNVRNGSHYGKSSVVLHIIDGV